MNTRKKIVFGIHYHSWTWLFGILNYYTEIRIRIILLGLTTKLLQNRIFSRRRYLVVKSGRFSRHHSEDCCCSGSECVAQARLAAPRPLAAAQLHCQHREGEEDARNQQREGALDSVCSNTLYWSPSTPCTLHWPACRTPWRWRWGWCRPGRWQCTRSLPASTSERGESFGLILKRFVNKWSPFSTS